jgi:oligosaccharide repeat unit polymerase
MLTLIFSGLFLLTAFNYYLGRSVFYPAFVFCAVWTVALFCLLVSGDMFFQVSHETLTIFMCGAIAFTVGGAAGKCVPIPPSHAQHREPKIVLTLIVTIFVVAFPFYVLWLFEVIADKPGILFLPSVREYFINITPEEYTWKFKLFINILTSAFFVALIAWNSKEGHKKRAVIAVTMAALYSLLTGGRATTVQIAISMLCIEWLQSRKLRLKALVAVAVFSALVFSISGALKNTNTENSISEKGSAMGTEFIGYIGGPLVAFDQVVRHPNIIPHYPNAAAYFYETAAKFSRRVTVPPQIAEFVPTGPDRRDNVYTIYFSYFDTGPLATCFLVAVEAFVLSILYRFALAGGQTAIVMYSALFGCLAFATFNDIAAANVAALLRAYVVCWLFYSFPLAKARFGRFIRASAQGRIKEIDTHQTTVTDQETT